MQILNPATNEVLQEIAEDSRAQITEKYEKVKAGQKSWAARPLSERIDIISKYAELVKDNLEDLAKTLTLEMGKPIRQSRNEINGAGGRIRFFLANAEKYLSEEEMFSDGGMREVIRYEPLGVIGNISAWNYPYNVGYNVFIPALLAGNSVLYKPSEFATLTGLKIRELLWKAGVPENVFECVIGTGQAGQTLLDLPLDGYFFTGSYKTGKYIAENVANKLVPVQLELGGKDPVYVCDDIPDVKSAAQGIADGAFYNNGQSCCAVERIYVHEKIYDAFVQHFTDEVKTFVCGDPLSEETYNGPLTRSAQLDFLDMQVKDALDKGAKLLLGGKRLEKAGNWYENTVLIDANHEMSLMKEESFGPIIGLMKVSGDAEAINLMNDTEYGLTAAVYTADANRADAISTQLHVGTVYWNCCDRVSPNVPWTGRGNSGLGSTLSYQGIRAFTQPKAYQMRS
ncbi:MAG: aldehyde dehydrogenase family protein [Flavobacteriales bacterium]|nr:aldehyde dehydrogenase family protein [Flavobacteriales bacterium]